MKRVLFVTFICLFLIGCSPSAETIQKAIEETQHAERDATEEESTQIPSPTSTSSPTYTPSPPKIAYIASGGNCLGWDYLPPGNPLDYENCDVDEKKQVQLSTNESVTYTSFSPSEYPSFCVLQTLDGETVSFSVDTNGVGKAVCTPSGAGDIKTPTDSFIFSGGNCLGWDYLPPGNPLDYENCDVEEKKQIQLNSEESVTYSSFSPSEYPSFCVLQTLEGETISYSVDTDGVGMAVCNLTGEEKINSPADSFIFSGGNCLGWNYLPPGNPLDYEYCDVEEKKRVQLSSEESVTYSSFSPSEYPSFCVLQTLEGETISYFVDTNGIGNAICTIP